MTPKELSERVNAAGQANARMLNAMWNPETRRYDKVPEAAVLLDFLHGQVNALLLVTCALRSMEKATDA